MKKYIVLDIDATLVHTHGEVDKYEILKVFEDEDKIKVRRKLYNMKLYDISGEPGAGEEFNLSGIYRPYLREFLDFCFHYFDGVVIWSAGKYDYVHKMCDLMFPLENRPLDILTFDDCDISRGIDNLKKPLTKLYKKHPQMKPENTFVLDDRDDTFSLNKKNGIMIPIFESDMSVEDITTSKDENFLKLMIWLDSKEVRECNDIRNLKKDKIFKVSLKEFKMSKEKKKEEKKEVKEKEVKKEKVKKEKEVKKENPKKKNKKN